MPRFRVVVLAGPDRGALFDVPADGGAVGRGAGNLIKLTDPAVSRTHGHLAREHGRLVWRDAGARHAAQLGGAPAEGRALAAGDELVLGRTRLVVLAPDGGLALLEGAASRVTAEVSAADLPGRRGRADLDALIGLADAILAAPSRVAAAAAAAAALKDHLRATRIDVIAIVGGRFEPLAGPDTTLSLDRAAVERALAGGAALTLDDGSLIAAFAPPRPGHDGGFVHARRGSAFTPAELELAVAAARVIGAFLGARGAHDATLRRARALEERVGAPAILGDSAAAAAVRRFVAKVAPSDAAVLLLGESGTGKELVASAIHAASARAQGPFVAVNCAALTDSLLESELFGHERGAFTGATEKKPGRFELADGGTLLLDEVGELTPKSQAKLLRVLEDRRVERVGGVRPIPVDVRVIAATNRDLEAMVKDGGFRDDLFFRLSVIQLRLPPLRDRADDVAALAEHFLASVRGRSPRTVRGFAPEALAALRRHAWPGNVRELRNAVERAVVLGDGEWITAEELGPARPIAAPSSPRSIRDAERDTIAAALAAAGGNKARAAAALGIDRTTLYKKLRSYGL